MQSADGVVELLAALVVAAHALAKHLEQPGIGDLGKLLLRSRHGQGFERVEQAARVAIGIGHQAVDCYIFDSRQRIFFLRQGHNLLQILLRQRLQYVDRRSRQQRGIHFKRRVLGRGANEGEQA